jgi:hypothetical protein
MGFVVLGADCSRYSNSRRLQPTCVGIGNPVSTGTSLSYGLSKKHIDDLDIVFREATCTTEVFTV